MAEMNCRITKSVTFDSAHWLPQVPESHKCRRMHGHTYELIVGLKGPIDPKFGWVQDYGEIKKALAPLLEELDHHCLNEIEGLENPTAEILACWIYHRLVGALPQLADVTICETPTTKAVYRP